MRCFYCDKLEVGILPAEAIPAREQKHIFKVLRGREDSEILLIDGRGSIAEAVIEEKRSLRILEVKQLTSPEIKVHLYVAPPRKNQMDQVLKQCAEVGVWSINPIITERSVAKPENGSALDRMKILLIEGCKQAHNPFLPTLNPIRKLGDTGDAISAFDHSFFGSTSKCGSMESNKQHTTLRNTQLSGDIAWIVGPEGGFSDKEEEFLINSGALPLQLGDWIMRVETAAITGAAYLAN